MMYEIQENYLEFTAVLDSHGVAIIPDDQIDEAADFMTRSGRTNTYVEGNGKYTRFYFEPPMTVDEADTFCEESE